MILYIIIKKIGSIILNKQYKNKNRVLNSIFIL
jgi:hypothetical protein